MHVVNLTARTRTGRGRGYRNRLKNQGYVPAVVYGKEIGSLPIAVQIRAVEAVLGRGGRNTLVALEIDPGNGKTAKWDTIIKEVQYHPFKNELLHVDFHQISLNEELTTNVAVRLVGEAPGVKAGGLVEHLLREIEVSCLPRNIPEAIEVDVSGLDIGDSIHVADLTPPGGVKFTTDGDVVVVTITAPERETEEAEPETVETVPGAEAE